MSNGASWRQRAAVYLVPAGVFQSVIVGGAYGTGREVAEFMTRFGALGGLLAIAVVALGFTVVLAACFEFRASSGSTTTAVSCASCSAAGGRPTRSAS